MKRRDIGTNNGNNENENFSLDTPLNEYYDYENSENNAFKKFGENNIFINNLHLHNDSGYSKVISEEELGKNEKKKLITKKRLLYGVLLAMLLATVGGVCWNLGKKTNNKPNKTNEDSFDEEQNDDVALANNGVTIDKEEQVGAYDEVVGDCILTFTDAYDDEQVLARAHAINAYLQASNVMDITDEELCDQIKFINGTYNTATDDEAWDMLFATAQTFSDLRTAMGQSVNFAGGVVDENGVHVALGLDAFLPDNCEHSDFMAEASTLYQNVLTASTMEEKINASKMFLKLESDLRLGLLETPNGTKLDCNSLTDSEFYIFWQMVQTANNVIYSALGENIEIEYFDNVGQLHKVTLEFLVHYYNPQCDGEYDTEYNTESVFSVCCNGLVQTAINKGKILTPSE